MFVPRVNPDSREETRDLPKVLDHLLMKAVLKKPLIGLLGLHCQLTVFAFEHPVPRRRLRKAETRHLQNPLMHMHLSWVFCSVLRQLELLTT